MIVHLRARRISRNGETQDQNALGRHLQSDAIRHGKLNTATGDDCYHQLSISILYL